MIQDSQTNKVYLAEGLIHYKQVFNNLILALSQEQIQVEILPRTRSKKHIWARDYMPIQLSKDKFLFYEYLPDYLQDDELFIPDYEGIVNDLHLKCDATFIVLDGGNIVKCEDKVIMTDKIFQENPKWVKHALINKLEKLMKATVVLIPWDRYDIYGHADGMVRYISDDRVLLNNYADIDAGLCKRLIKALEPHFFIEKLEYGTPRCGKLSWAYLNFLHVKNCVFVPGLHAKEDQLAFEQIQHFYPDCNVIQIQGCEDLAREGGALNCISWNIKAD